MKLPQLLRLEKTGHRATRQMRQNRRKTNHATKYISLA